jgi:hypothetical protein
VDSVGANGLRVAGRDVVVDASTRIRDRDDKAIALSDIKAGDVVEVEGVAGPGGSVLARKIRLEDSGDDDPQKPEDGQEVELKGSIESKGASSLVVAHRTVQVDGGTKILGKDGDPMTFAGLQVGDQVEVEGRAQNDAVLAKKIKIED